MTHSQSTAPMGNARTGSESAVVAPERRVVTAPARFTLLRLSALDRLLGASFVVALIWAGVYWALH